MLDVFSLVVVPVPDRQRVSTCKDTGEEEGGKGQRKEGVDEGAFSGGWVRDGKREKMSNFHMFRAISLRVYVYVGVGVAYSPLVVSLSRMRKVPLWLPWPSSCLSASFLPILPKYHLSP